jgi:predicted AlkP superfamily phosphohydrolase/phosphomutase
MSRILVIGLDAIEHTLMQELMRTGRAPNLAKLAESGRFTLLDAPCMDTVPGAIWPDIHTGRPASMHGEYFHPEQIHTGEAAPRETAREELDTEHYFWVRAGRAGKRFVVVDPIQAAPASDLEDPQVLEWAIHDQHWGRMTVPESLGDELVGRHGAPNPVRCERHDRSTESFLDLTSDLIAQVDLKADVALDVLEKHPWELGLVTFTEGHCAGHQLWHLTDPASPFYEDRGPELADSIAKVYSAVDGGVGRLLDAVGPDTLVMAVFSHGMSPSVAGYRLLGPVLAGLGLGQGRPPMADLRQRIPFGVRALLRDHIVPGFITARLQLNKRGLERAGMLVSPVSNNRVGAIRYNLVGREAGGELEPERIPEIEELITTELLALTDPETGERIVKSVRTATEVFGDDYHPDLPDLLVEFRRDLGVLENAVGPTVGAVHAPSRVTFYDRTGDHTGHSAILLAGPGASDFDPMGTNLDIAPAILQYLGVETEHAS